MIRADGKAMQSRSDTASVGQSVVVLSVPMTHHPYCQPERFVSLGLYPPKGVLLFGPPGTGRTLCARAVANRTDATFIRVIRSELVCYLSCVVIMDNKRSELGVFCPMYK